ncbi:hypothetical protein [Pseudoalteromonas luteoviolacea]|uniref:Uncharacterized protein n=1 Tax=Pseudoalteromonas luteoviolacea S4054 TaxID=1129367 RepID=A0A0F6A8Q0_9GAMM|nr:hypothetical protein [Pseudoalteromonas luteoviolacea]AOT08621.1 hypothetical protein S4054249_12490 [Pseudoalteromonas luteoviolacea]AOT13536.1 hypothetical protein S40542_12465 [Pseudoalteromonas luteoviolacea]AOT18449.1 hypothetical protein S4054_12465 [Pseudoalteromonas luteoviolacea]KKE82555.1 hypothetical protein N479_18275 [Pseudoalteromonas luteoviolacea S4054]KZN72092.1 hypothetical protein N481_16910 [Pseudoalteromonas luteoviolacea S4047-1]
MINSVGINSYYQVSTANSQATHSNQVQNHQRLSESNKTEYTHSAPERQFDFSNMTLKEQSEAAEELYQQGVLSFGEVAFMTGRYNLIKHDGQLGGTTLAQAQSEKFNVITQLKDNLASVKQQGMATDDVVKNYESMIRKLEVYQYGLNTSA